MTPARCWSSPAGHVSGDEWSLPTGAVHVAIRLEDEPVLLRASPSAPPLRRSPLVVGPARAQAWVRTPARGPMVGFVVAPGTCEALLGVPASALGDWHVDLADVVPWAHQLRALARRAPLEAREQVVRAFLTQRARPQRVDPLVQALLAALRAGTGVEAFARDSGRSHRAVLTRFTRAVGLTPRAWRSIARLQRALRLLDAGLTLAEAAAEAGYADQPHLTRAFRQHTTLTPTEVQARRRVGEPTHVAVR